MKWMFIAIVALLVTSPVSAQASHPAAVVVKIPFDFIVRNRTFPAGTYKFQSLLNSVPGKDTIDVLEVRSTEGRLYQAIVTDVVGREEPNRPKLVFASRGGEAILSEVWEPGKRAGCKLQNHEQITEATEEVTLIASVDQR